MTILICQEMLANQKPTPPSGWKIRIDSMDINELTGLKVGLVINFNVPVLKEGIKRISN